VLGEIEAQVLIDLVGLSAGAGIGAPALWLALSKVSSARSTLDAPCQMARTPFS
jgi:hypothetical protein